MATMASSSHDQLVQSQTSVLKQLHFGVSNNYVNNPKYYECR